MRLLQVTLAFGSIGGMETYIARSCQHLVSRGHEVVVYASAISGPARHSFDTISYGNLHDDRAPGHPAILVEAVEFAVEYHPDVVLFHQTAPESVLAEFANRFRVCLLVHGVLCEGAKLFRRGSVACDHPISARCIVDWYLGPCGSEASPMAAIAAYRKATASVRVLKGLERVIVGSEYLYNYLLGEGVNRKRLSLINDLDVGIEEAATDRRVLTSKRLLYVGRVVQNKGIQDVIHALALLPHEFILSVVGEGWYLPTLKKLATDLGIEKRVEFHGALIGVALEEQYDSAAVAVVPSLVPEGAALVVPEAVSRKLPVVAYDSGGIIEWSAKYKEIYVVPRGSRVELARAVVEAQGRTGVPSQYQRSVVGSPLEEVLRSVCDVARGSDVERSHSQI